MAKNSNINSKKSTSKSKSRVNPDTLQDALRNLKSRFATNDIKSMKQVAGAYATGMPFALGMSYDTMIKRFHNPELLTLDDLLTTADITETEVDIVIKVAIAEAKRNHVKKDINPLCILNNAYF